MKFSHPSVAFSPEGCQRSDLTCTYDLRDSETRTFGLGAVSINSIMNYRPSSPTLQRIPGRTQLLKLLASGVPLQVTEQQKMNSWRLSYNDWGNARASTWDNYKEPGDGQNHNMGRPPVPARVGLLGGKDIKVHLSAARGSRLLCE
jgi:hypothetical protein